MKGLIHHLDLTVADPWASAPFYDAVLGFMGFVREDEDERGIDWRLPGAPSFYTIGIVKARMARAHDRLAPGLHHVAWHAESRADVDAMHALLMEISATVLDPPKDYPEYAEGYYAVFFADPDGLKLEYVFGGSASV